MTTTAPAPAARKPVEPGAAPPPPERKYVSRWIPATAIVAVWIVVWYFTDGTDTLTLPGVARTDLHDRLTEFNNDLLASRDTNPVMQFTNAISDLLRSAFEWVQRMIVVPNPPRPVPEIGWLGVVAIATYVGLVIANWRIAILVCLSFLSFGVLGFWQDSLDLLIVTGISVAIVIVLGMPLAVLVGTSPRANKVITVVLDLMQTMPTFVYLLPVVLFFGIGVSAAVVSTHDLRAAAAGPDRRLRDQGGPDDHDRGHRLGRSDVLAAALQGAAADGAQDDHRRPQPDHAGRALDGHPGGLRQRPGSRQARPRRTAHQRRRGGVRAGRADRGDGRDARPHHDSGQRALREGGPWRRRQRPAARRIILAAGGVGTLVAIYLSRTYIGLAEFPVYTIGDRIAEVVNDVMDWVTSTFGGITGAFKDFITNWLLNPMQNLIAESPWYVSFVAIAALAFVFGGARALVSTLVCLTGIWYFDLWHDAMITLTMTLVATVLVMILALVFGVWMARDRKVDFGIRPFLDAGQTIPPFVYLIPVLALFGPSRFTAIVAGVVYAAPAAIKLVADGVKAVSPTTIEAGRSTGQTTWQEITKVQLPMAKGSLVLATNQGLLYVLSMTVIGGLVGAGALGYDVVYGFARSEAWGKGLAAGITIVLLGVMLDRITRAAADVRRDDGAGPRRAFHTRLPIGFPGDRKVVEP